MRLDDVAIALRPRTPWEAVDLGVAVYRRWWKPVMVAWAFTALPALLVVAVAVEDLWWALLIAVLLEPLLERVPLHVVSRAIFGATPELRDTLRALPELWSRSLVGVYLPHRLHPARPTIAPVAVLEGLRGSQRRRREAVLLRRLKGLAFLLGASCRLIQLALVLACFALVLLFVPVQHLPDAGELRDLEGVGLGWVSWLARAAWILSYSVIGPLHAVCGFALYLNRRTDLEGWDVEVAFRRLGRRISEDAGGAFRRVGAVLLGLVLAGALAAPARATGLQEGDEADPSRVVQEVLASPDFETEKVASRWGLPDPATGSGPLGASVELLALLVEVLAWTAAAALLAWFAYVVGRSVGWIERRPPSRPVEPEPPVELFGLDVRPASLPDDVPGTVLRWWREGRGVEALGLLYRASIARLIEREDVPFQASDTERDCLRRVEEHGGGERTRAFAAVTRAWQAVAYSPDEPSDAVVERLCSAWEAHFGGAAAGRGPSAP